jgi:hypothetical protein
MAPLIIIIIIIIIITIIMAPRRTAKTRPENEETTNHLWTALPKADVDRLYVPRKRVGRGLMQLEAAHAVEITKLVEYVDRKEDPLIQVARTHQQNINSTVSNSSLCSAYSSVCM